MSSPVTLHLTIPLTQGLSLTLKLLCLGSIGQPALAPLSSALLSAGVTGVGRSSQLMVPLSYLSSTPCPPPLDRVSCIGMRL